MNAVHVDSKARRARVQGGATWGDFDREAQLYSLATPGGLISATGVGGLTLAGGLGWLRGKYGLSLDNLVSVDIVTADGVLRTASERENADLFWGVRGGGGNFGVITSFEFKVHPVGPVVMFLAPVYRAEDAPRVMRGWRDFMATAPDEIGGTLVEFSPGSSVSPSPRMWLA
jgi:FAD/FMN-containing dehydrogenase